MDVWGLLVQWSPAACNGRLGTFGTVESSSTTPDTDYGLRMTKPPRSVWGEYHLKMNATEHLHVHEPIFTNI